MKSLNIFLILLTFFGSFYLVNAQSEKKTQKPKKNSQTKKGNILIGENSNLNHSSLNSKIGSRAIDTKTSIEFSPKIGLFISSNSALGFELPFSYLSEKSKIDDDKFTSSYISFAPFIRRYFGTSNIKPYLERQVGFGRIKNEYRSSSFYDGSLFTNESSANLFLYEIEGGLVFFKMIKCLLT